VFLEPGVQLWSESARHDFSFCSHVLISNSSQFIPVNYPIPKVTQNFGGKGLGSETWNLPKCWTSNWKNFHPSQVWTLWDAFLFSKKNFTSLASFFITPNWSTQYDNSEQIKADATATHYLLLQ